MMLERNKMERGIHEIVDTESYDFKHRYTGLAQVTNWVRLKFAAMNLKNFSIRKREDTHSPFADSGFLAYICSKPQFCLNKTGFFRQD